MTVPCLRPEWLPDETGAQIFRIHLGFRLPCGFVVRNIARRAGPLYRARRAGRHARFPQVELVRDSTVTRQTFPGRGIDFLTRIALRG
jgi:hypothetical protein